MPRFTTDGPVMFTLNASEAVLFRRMMEEQFACDIDLLEDIVAGRSVGVELVLARLGLAARLAGVLTAR